MEYYRYSDGATGNDGEKRRRGEGEKIRSPKPEIGS